MRELENLVGYTLLIVGLLVILPPYPDIADSSLWLIYGEHTGTNNLFKQVIDDVNPANWNYDILEANKEIFIRTAILVYGTGVLMFLSGAWILGKNPNSELNKFKRKVKKWL